MTSICSWGLEREIGDDRCLNVYQPCWVYSCVSELGGKMTHTNLIQTNIHFEKVAGVAVIKHMLFKPIGVSTVQYVPWHVAFNSWAPWEETNCKHVHAVLLMKVTTHNNHWKKSTNNKFEISNTHSVFCLGFFSLAKTTSVVGGQACRVFPMFIKGLDTVVVISHIYYSIY